MRDVFKYKICRVLMAVQFFFVSLVIITEIIQVIVFLKFFRNLTDQLRSVRYDSNGTYTTNNSGSEGPFYFNSPTILAILDPSLNLNPEELYFTNVIVGKGPIAIWVFIVMIISFLSLIGYAFIFSKVWNFRKSILFLGFNAAFVLLWISEVFSNLIWVYNGISSPCYIISTSEPISVYFAEEFPEIKTICEAYIASNVFGWFVLVSFVIGLEFSFEVYRDAKSEALNDKNIDIDNIDKINNTADTLQPPQQIHEKSLRERAESLQEHPPSSAA